VKFALAYLYSNYVKAITILKSIEKSIQMVKEKEHTIIGH
jgi:hypothetical protein